MESIPPVRDDEPTPLRQDTDDEPAEHLQTALQHQLLATRDESSARANVFERFRDLSSLARQLWLEAMQEKIMSKRVSQAATALLAITCLVAVGMMWRYMELAQAATRELAEESRATNRVLVDRLTQLSARIPVDGAATAGSRSLDWNQVKAHLVLGEKDGPPAEGFTVRLSQMQSKGGISNFETIAEECTGPDGIADLAVVPPGKYVLCAMMTSGNLEWFSTQVNVLPGSTQMIEIICPREKIEKAGVVIQVEIPEDLRRNNLYVTAEMVLGPRDFSGSEWRSGFNGAAAYDPLVVIVFAPDGRVGLTYQGIMNHSNEGEPIQMLPSDSTGQGFGKPEERPLELFTTNYYLRTIRIGSPLGSAIAAPSVGVGAFAPSKSGQPATPGLMAVKSEWHFLPENKRIYPGIFLDYRIASRDLASLQTFKSATGLRNVWRIIVPDEVWEKARRDLGRAEQVRKEMPTTPVENNLEASPVR